MNSEDVSADREGDHRRTGEEALRDVPAPDALYRSLASSERRRVLYVLLERQHASVDELADVLSGWKATTEGGVVGAETRRRLYTALHHTHLPQLSEAGVVTYDAGDRTVSLASLPETAAEAIRIAARYDELLAANDT